MNNNFDFYIFNTDLFNIIFNNYDSIVLIGVISIGTIIILFSGRKLGEMALKSLQGTVAESVITTAINTGFGSKLVNQKKNL